MDGTTAPLPSDELLNRAVQEQSDRWKAEVNRQASDPEIYEKRLERRGWTSEPQARWIYDKRTKSKRPIANRRHAASAAVHDGTIALTVTQHPPTTLTLPIWFKTDEWKAKDHNRKDRKYVLLPDQETIEGETVDGITPITDHIQYATFGAKAALADAEEQEQADNVALQKLAHEAEVSDLDLELIIQNKRLKVSLRQLADQEGVSHTAILKRIGRALGRMMRRSSDEGTALLKRMRLL
jgi:hypothetical protein